jgi:hypothetical protein
LSGENQKPIFNAREGMFTVLLKKRWVTCEGRSCRVGSREISPCRSIFKRPQVLFFVNCQRALNRLSPGVASTMHVDVKKHTAFFNGG